MYKVMIVDDETIILSGIKFLVDWEKIGCVISATARNGEDALEQIRKMPPDIVLADINMPVMDGITLPSKVSQEFPILCLLCLRIWKNLNWPGKRCRTGLWTIC